MTTMTTMLAVDVEMLAVDVLHVKMTTKTMMTMVITPTMMTKDITGGVGKNALGSGIRSDVK
jgi:hypothetical protein